MKFTIPQPLQHEHEALHERLRLATQAGGEVGEAAKALAHLMHPHFVKEDQIALPPLGLLAALALPSYQQQQRQARRSDGQGALLQMQLDQARWRSAHESHAETLSTLGWPSDRSDLGHYQIALLSVSADGYTVQATALGAQAADSACSPLRLSWQGTATSILSAGVYFESDPARCWRQ